MKYAVGRLNAFLCGAVLTAGIAASTPASSEDLPAKNFTRIAWLSSCDSHEAVTYFYLDLLSEGLLRYQGVTDVKTPGSKEEQLDGKAARQLRSAVRDFLAGKVRAGKDDGGATFCIRVEAYKAGRVADSQSELIYANQPPEVLQKINQSAAPGKWACPARLSSTKSGSKSARYCGQPAFMMAVVGQSACDVIRHVEVYLDGSVYIATRSPPRGRLTDHSYYELDPATVERLVDTINTYEAVGSRPFEDSEKIIYRRSRPEDVEDLKRRLAELTGVKWTSLEGAASCEPSGATAEVSLRRDLDRSVKEETSQP